MEAALQGEKRRYRLRLAYALRAEMYRGLYALTDVRCRWCTRKGFLVAEEELALLECAILKSGIPWRTAEGPGEVRIRTTDRISETRHCNRSVLLRLGRLEIRRSASQIAEIVSPPLRAASSAFPPERPQFGDGVLLRLARLFGM